MARLFSCALLLRAGSWSGGTSLSPSLDFSQTTFKPCGPVVIPHLLHAFLFFFPSFFLFFFFLFFLLSPLRLGVFAREIPRFSLATRGSSTFLTNSTTCDTFARELAARLPNLNRISKTVLSVTNPSSYLDRSPYFLLRQMSFVAKSCALFCCSFAGGISSSFLFSVISALLAKNAGGRGRYLSCPHSWLCSYPLRYC